MWHHTRPLTKTSNYLSNKKFCLSVLPEKYLSTINDDDDDDEDNTIWFYENDIATTNVHEAVNAKENKVTAIPVKHNLKE